MDLIWSRFRLNDHLTWIQQFNKLCICIYPSNIIMIMRLWILSFTRLMEIKFQILTGWTIFIWTKLAFKMSQWVSRMFFGVTENIHIKYHSCRNVLFLNYKPGSVWSRSTRAIALQVRVINKGAESSWYFLKNRFLVVSDIGDWFLSDAFGTMKKYCS